MRREEWGRINKVAVAGMKMREDLLEVMDVYAADHEHASPELKTAMDLLSFSLGTLERVLCEAEQPALEPSQRWNRSSQCGKETPDK